MVYREKFFKVGDKVFHKIHEVGEVKEDVSGRFSESYAVFFKRECKIIICGACVLKHTS